VIEAPGLWISVLTEPIDFKFLSVRVMSPSGRSRRVLLPRLDPPGVRTSDEIVFQSLVHGFMGDHSDGSWTIYVYGGSGVATKAHRFGFRAEAQEEFKMPPLRHAHAPVFETDALYKSTLVYRWQREKVERIVGDFEPSQSRGGGGVESSPSSKRQAPFNRAFLWGIRALVKLGLYYPPPPDSPEHDVDPSIPMGPIPLRAASSLAMAQSEVSRERAVIPPPPS
jgi:hypothetical protein